MFLGVVVLLCGGHRAVKERNFFPKIGSTNYSGKVIVTCFFVFAESKENGQNLVGHSFDILTKTQHYGDSINVHTSLAPRVTDLLAWWSPL